MSDEDPVVLARIAENAERYEDMAMYMATYVKKGKHLNTDQRNIFSVAYKNVVGSKRSAWRVVSTIEQKVKAGSDVEQVEVAHEYRSKIEEELNAVCNDVLGLLNDYLVPGTDGNEEENESRVFYLKMIGDYNRYKAEVASESNKEETITASKEAYLKAEKAAEGMSSTHPIRLGLALNSSVFYYEIMDEQESACRIAKKAFDDAIADLDQLKEDSYKDSTLIMQLLRDNLTLWTSDNQTEEEAGGGGEEQS